MNVRQAMAALVWFQYQNNFLDGALQHGECRCSFALGVQIGGADNQTNLANKVVIAFSNFRHTTKDHVLRGVSWSTMRTIAPTLRFLCGTCHLSFSYALELFLLPAWSKLLGEELDMMPVLLEVMVFLDKTSRCGKRGCCLHCEDMIRGQGFQCGRIIEVTHCEWPAVHNHHHFIKQCSKGGIIQSPRTQCGCDFQNVLNCTYLLLPNATCVTGHRCIDTNSHWFAAK